MTNPILLGPVVVVLATAAMLAGSFLPFYRVTTTVGGVDPRDITIDFPSATATVGRPRVTNDAYDAWSGVSRYPWSALPLFVAAAAALYHLLRMVSSRLSLRRA